MDGRAMPTGGLPAVRQGLGLMTYPPQITSVRSARRFVEEAVATSDVPDLADDAGLLTSELAANAVLHARTDFDVAVYSIHDGVRISVRDRSASLPALVAPSATAMSGRGLSLVQALATRWGAGPSTSAPKSVWFELTTSRAIQGGGPSAGALEDLSVEDLLAAWSEDAEESEGLPATGSDPRATAAVDTPVVDPPARGDARFAVTLPALDAADLLGAKEAMDDVLRELQLLLLAQPPAGQSPVERGGAAPPTLSGGHTTADLAVADRLDRAARAFAEVRSQVRHQVSRAVAAGQEHVALHLVLGQSSAQQASAYAEAVEAAEQLAGSGSLLSVAGALARHRAVRRAYLLEVIAAASS